MRKRPITGMILMALLLTALSLAGCSVDAEKLTGSAFTLYVPESVGSSGEEAGETCCKAGPTPETVCFIEPDKPGNVIFQTEPVNGAKVRAGSNVKLYCAAYEENERDGSRFELIWPVPTCHTITKNFGILWGERFNGIEISSETISGATVIASEYGTVVRSGDEGTDDGLCVEIDHENGYRTRYCHLSGSLVGVGETVGKGQPVGLVGRTGVTPGPNLYFEILENDVPIDPMSVLDPEKDIIGASVFSEGSIRIIIGCGALLIGAAVGFLIGRKKFGGKKDAEDK